MSEDVEQQDVNDISSDLPDETEEVEPSDESSESSEEADDSEESDVSEESDAPEALEVEVEEQTADNECEGASTVSSSELSSLKEKLNAKSGQLLRLAADFDNFKKRQRRDTQLQVQNFAEKLMKGLLPALDSMDRAKETVDDGEDIEHLREGFMQIFNLFHKALSDAGVTSMDVLGHPFDPRFHEALMHHPSEGIEPGSITVELQKGWIMGDRVLRAARVGVAPDAPSEPEPVEECDAPEEEIEVQVVEEQIETSEEVAEDVNDSEESGEFEEAEETEEIVESEETDNCCDGAEGDCDGADKDCDSDDCECDGACNSSDEASDDAEEPDETDDTADKSAE